MLDATFGCPCCTISIGDEIALHCIRLEFDVKCFSDVDGDDSTSESFDMSRFGIVARNFGGNIESELKSVFDSVGFCDVRLKCDANGVGSSSADISVSSS